MSEIASITDITPQNSAIIADFSSETAAPELSEEERKKAERKAKHREEQRRYRAAHKDEIKIRNQRYYASHIKERQAYSREWAKNHREELRAAKHAYHVANRAKLIARAMEWAETHRVECREYSRAYERRHREDRAVKTRARRAEKRILAIIGASREELRGMIIRPENRELIRYGLRRCFIGLLQDVAVQKQEAEKVTNALRAALKARREAAEAQRKAKEERRELERVAEAERQNAMRRERNRRYYERHAKELAAKREAAREAKRVELGLFALQEAGRGYRLDEEDVRRKVRAFESAVHASREEEAGDLPAAMFDPFGGYEYGT